MELDRQTAVASKVLARPLRGPVGCPSCHHDPLRARDNEGGGGLGEAERLGDDQSLSRVSLSRLCDPWKLSRLLCPHL